MQEPVPGIKALPDDDNGRYFHVEIAGPNDVSSVYYSLSTIRQNILAYNTVKQVMWVEC